MQLDPKWDWSNILLFAILSIVGGSLGYTMRTLDANEKLSFYRVALEGLSAGFIGIIAGLVCMEYGLSLGYSSAIIGVLAWMGSRATFLVARSVIAKRTGVNLGGNADDTSGTKS